MENLNKVSYMNHFNLIFLIMAMFLYALYKKVFSHPYTFGADISIFFYEISYNTFSRWLQITV